MLPRVVLCAQQFSYFSCNLQVLLIHSLAHTLLETPQRILQHASKSKIKHNIGIAIPQRGCVFLRSKQCTKFFRTLMWDQCSFSFHIGFIYTCKHVTLLNYFCAVLILPLLFSTFHSIYFVRTVCYSGLIDRHPVHFVDQQLKIIIPSGGMDQQRPGLSYSKVLFYSFYLFLTYIYILDHVCTSSDNS